MATGREWKLNDLAEQLGGRVVGDGEQRINGVASLRAANSAELSFFSEGGYRDLLMQTRAGAVILKDDDLADCPVAAIVVEQPRRAFVVAVNLMQLQHRQLQPDVHSTAVVDGQAVVAETARVGANVVVEEGAKIGANAEVGAGCFIGRGAVIGRDSVLSPGVHFGWGCALGEGGYLHPGVVIGGDGFGFLPGEPGEPGETSETDKAYGQGWEKIPQLGAVTIGDNVEIGANTTVDRGTLEDTVISDGVKLDAQVHIGHNVYVGENTVIAGCTGIAGSVRIGSKCMIGGACGITDHVEIAAQVTLMGMTAVTKSIRKPGVYASTLPAKPVVQWRRNVVRLGQLDNIVKRLSAVERKLDE